MEESAVIDLSSENEDDAGVDAFSVTVEPKNKKPKLDKSPPQKGDVIVLTDDEEREKLSQEKIRIVPPNFLECVLNGKKDSTAKTDENLVALSECLKEETEVDVPKTAHSNGDPLNLETKSNKTSKIEVSKKPAENTNSQSESEDSEAMLSLKYKSEASSIVDVSNERKLPKELEEFFAQCRKNIKHKTTINLFDEKVKMVRKNALIHIEHVNSKEFSEFLEELSEQLKNDPSKSINIFGQLSKHISDQKIELSDEAAEKKLDFYYNLLDQLKERIDKLAEEEVDLDDDDNSSFLMFQKYREKAASVIRKIRTLENVDYHYGLDYFNRLDFSASQIQKFNIILNKKFGDMDKNPFPTFREVNKYLRKTAKKYNVQLEEPALKAEIKSCFEELGKLIQRKRRHDLKYLHHSYCPSNDDPAKDDEVLRKRLEENASRANNAMEDVLNKFTSLQEEGYVDSDDSKASNSEEGDDSDEDSSAG